MCPQISPEPNTAGQASSGTRADQRKALAPRLPSLVQHERPSLIQFAERLDKEGLERCGSVEARKALPQPRNSPKRSRASQELPDASALLVCASPSVTPKRLSKHPTPIARPPYAKASRSTVPFVTVPYCGPLLWFRLLLSLLPPLEDSSRPPTLSKTTLHLSQRKRPRKGRPEADCTRGPIQ